ncbi:MAG TPA: hypothetical protein VN915_02465 [Elusimicrobiota bacterium]|nr:hypothetical protein [Elusimicrobiota bacterium]
MRIALIGLAALLPALASADDASPAPYVLHQGRAVRAESGPPAGEGSSAPRGSTGQGSRGVSMRQVSNFGAAPVRTSVVGGRSSFTRSSAPSPAPAARGFRRASAHRRGITGGSAPTASTPSDSAAPPYAVPGAKIISAGQPPVYSEAAGGGTHSVEGGGFIAMDQTKAHDVGRAPGITWAPPDTPPGRNANMGGGGSGASANGPMPASSGSSGSTNTDGSGGHISGTGDGGNNNSNNNGNGSQDSATGFNPSF